ncbi:MAG TPA: hypothetical protein PKL84_17160 [Candidatus Hydrogenedentes bacterium]|nr:hypothetical protein [Candidatus Hydrogenedentota bacterium]
MAGATGLEPATSGVTGGKPPVDKCAGNKDLHISETPRCTDCCTPDAEMLHSEAPDPAPATGADLDPLEGLAAAIRNLDPEQRATLVRLLVGDNPKDATA